jgi:hypothetical protein
VSYSSADSTGPRNHIWFVEFAREPASTRKFEQTLDEELSQSCESYRRARACHALEAPQLQLIPQGGMSNALRRMGRTIDAQTKVPCMSETSELADALMAETRGSAPASAPALTATANA